MDIVLQIVDTFLFDRFYATILPASSSQIARNAAKNAVTSTFSSMREVPTAYASASKFLTLKPSHFAYMSAWPRDFIWRQAVSLFLITWYAMAVGEEPFSSISNGFVGFLAAYSILSSQPYPSYLFSTMLLSLIRNTSKTKCA
jgi:hypothetical protein